MTAPKYLFDIFRKKRAPVGVSAKMRSMVIERDGRVCKYCRRALDEVEVTIDHIVSRSRGGRAEFSNLTVACRPCNASKGAWRVWPDFHVCGRHAEPGEVVR